MLFLQRRCAEIRIQVGHYTHYFGINESKRRLWISKSLAVKKKNPASQTEKKLNNVFEMSVLITPEMK